jgi:hypothetical protein
MSLASFTCRVTVTRSSVTPAPERRAHPGRRSGHAQRQPPVSDVRESGVRVRPAKDGRKRPSCGCRRDPAGGRRREIESFQRASPPNNGVTRARPPHPIRGCGAIITGAPGASSWASLAGFIAFELGAAGPEGGQPGPNLRFVAMASDGRCGPSLNRPVDFGRSSKEGIKSPPRVRGIAPTMGDVAWPSSASGSASWAP